MTATMEANNETKTFTLPVRLNGQTRQVEFRELLPGRAWSSCVAIGRCGRTGQKRWPANIYAFYLHGKWHVDYTFYHLNRNTGRLIDWPREGE